jgi:hypothetical protein
MRAVIAIAFGASIVAAANAETATQMRVVDKTFICTTSAVGAGLQAFKVGPWYVLSPPSSQKVVVSVFVNGDGQFVSAHDHCKASSSNVPFHRGALPGPDLFGSVYSCVFPGRILVRVRSTVTAQHLDHSQLAVRLVKRSVPIAYGTSKATGTKDSSGNERYAFRFWVSNRCNKTGG